MLVGIVGGGQLGRMLALAGIPLGFRFRFLDPSPDAPAAAAAQQIVGAYDDHECLAQLARGADLVTYEFENVPVASARMLGSMAPVHPPPRALEVAQDRLVEKTLFTELGIPFTPYRTVDSPDGLAAALADVRPPAVLKARRLGYDGKGQAGLRSTEDIERAWDDVHASAILEARVEFDRELSILAVRGLDRQTLFYPLVENLHADGILRRSRAPAPGVSADLQAQAEAHAARILDALDYVGVLAIELFQVGDRLLANEMAPRVHNSGHWTIEGAETSQFENHLRAIAGLPLGSTAVRGHVGMLNVIGAEPEPGAILAVPGAHLHRYGKAGRAGRKVGHVTIRADDPAALDAAMGTLDFLLA